MYKLFTDTVKFFGKGAVKAAKYSYATRQDVKEGHNTGLLHSLLTGKITTLKGASFSSEAEQLKLFSRFGKSGLLIDGKSKSLSLDDSFKHLLLVAQTGAGKTTKFIIPNVLKLADNQNSIIVTDPSGEIFSHTSGYMQSKGFKVLKFDPKDPSHSIYFNPLRFIFTYDSGRTYIDQVRTNLLASSLVASCMTSKDDSYWRAGAESLIEFFVNCLRDTPREFHNLYSVYKLLEQFTPDGKLLEEFIIAYVNEQRLQDKWLSLINNSGDTLRSHIASAQTALRALGNDLVAKMLSKNSIDFKSFRKEKTILYLTFPVNEAHFYTFILNLFYTQLFHELMAELPQKHDLPVYILYDEFGHANIPNFATTITNIRKYKVSLSLVLQSFSQLEKQYGRDNAETIVEGGINSKLFYAGAGLDTAKEIESMLGRVIEKTTTYSNKNNDEKTHREEYNLLNADQIRTLPAEKAIFFSGNKKPVLLDVVPYYKNGKFKGKVKFGEAHIAANSYHKFKLRSVLETV